MDNFSSVKDSLLYDEGASVVTSSLVVLNVRSIAQGKCLGTPTTAIRHHALVGLVNRIFDVPKRAYRRHLRFVFLHIEIDLA